MTIRESQLQFDFKDEDWSHLFKFDEAKDFIHAQDAISGTKGVDFSGILKKESLVLFEVKNFKGHRIENRPRMMGGDDPLWLEVSRKMRDAVAVIVGGARNSTLQQVDWSAYLDVLKNRKKTLHLVLWL